MNTSHKRALSATGVVLLGAVITWAPGTANRDTAGRTAMAPVASTVAVVKLQPTTLPMRVSATGNIMAWQETIIGSEAHGRLIEVNVNVGDPVRRGQTLATFAADAVAAELAQSRALVAEAEVALAQAAANARRAQLLQESGALAAQQIQQYFSAKLTAQARLDAAKAGERTQQLRLAQTRLTAPDDGVISARAATVGAVAPAGQELFRLVRGSRLEWRAEVAGADLIKLKPGQKAWLTPAGGDVIEGRLRTTAPVIDIQTRNGLVYVDLPSSETARAGMFARGWFEIGAIEVMTLPQSAVQLRDGRSYVLRVGTDSRLIQTPVTVGRRSGNRVEIISGLAAEDRVVAVGAALLGDGDLVRMIEAPTATPPAGPPATQQISGEEAQ